MLFHALEKSKCFLFINYYSIKMANTGDKRLSNAFQECSPSMIRNVCIIAHVDHGKTTLADFLVSANGIISARLAGKLRYMDSREDEQTRGITMKSSAITLYYEPLLLNLIDSPGHVDFCTEVSSAVNLADIAILLVDAVEGVCSQTESLIRQALTRKLDIILVLNKLDRLIVELKMSVAEAHGHLQRLIEFVNACLSKAIQGQLLEEDWKTFDQIESQLHFDPSKGNVLFASALHGYAFALEDFGQLWAKRLAVRSAWEQQPAMKGAGQKKLIEEEIATLKTKLVQHLFSRDHYFAQKNGEICTAAEQKGRKTLFEQFVLEPIWEVHKCALIEKNIDRLRQLASKLALPTLKGKRADEAFAELMRNWLPLSSTVVRACARGRSAQKAYQVEDRRLRELFYTVDGFPTGTTQLNSIHSLSSPLPRLPSTAIAIRECDPANLELSLSFVAKSFKAVDQCQQQRRISLCRIMCGRIKIGDQLYVLLKSSLFSGNIPSNKYLPTEDDTDASSNSLNGAISENARNWQQIRVSALFILLGRELIHVDQVPCGRICGIEVNDGEWIAGPLLSSRPLRTEETPQLDVNEQRKFAEPLVRVIIRPSNPGQAEFDDLRAALRQLAVLDSAVRILEPKENELVLLTAGEVHLQKCVEDLNALGQTELVVSEPIVPFLETIVPDPRVSIGKIMTDQLTECCLRQFSLRVRIRAVPLAGIEEDTQKLLELLQKNRQLIDSLREEILNAQHRAKVDSFRGELAECASECLPRLRGSWWAKRSKTEIRSLFTNGILAFGPAKAKFNILFNNNALEMDLNSEEQMEGGSKNNGISVWNANLRPLEQAMVGGFHSAMASGPLCDEPLQAVGIILEEWSLENGKNQGEINKQEDIHKNDQNIREDIIDEGLEHELINGAAAAADSENNECAKQKHQQINFKLHSNAQLHGQLISAFRQTCRASLKKHKGALRLLAAMYQCRVQTPEQTLGKVQAVLAQKRAKVHSEEINELSGLFEIGAHLPVVESFSFCEQLRKRSSGTASAQLEFAGWQLIDEDPYWEPSTEEEMEEFGGAGLIQQNQARQYMDAVRRRKGLPTEDVIVVSAEKQRNLKRNK